MKTLISVIAFAVALSACSSTPDRDFYVQQQPQQRIIDPSYPLFADARTPPWRKYNVETPYIPQDRELTVSYNGKSDFRLACYLNCNQSNFNPNPYPKE